MTIDEIHDAVSECGCNRNECCRLWRCDSVRVLLAEIDLLRAELHPPGKYRCGCPAVRADSVNAFCPVHHQVLVIQKTESKP